MQTSNPTWRVVSLAHSGETLRQTVLTLERLCAFAAMRPARPQAFFLTAADLDTVGSLAPTGLLVVRGAKHPARPLRSYLAPRGAGLVAIRANYRQAGQAERGARSLLSPAPHKPAFSAMLIAVPPPLFEELWQRAVPAPATAEIPVGGVETQAGLALADLLQEAGIQVPASLARAFVGESEAADLVRRLIVCAARVDVPILIEGETGTGKEVVARQIHALGPRVTGCFVHVNCGGIPENLLESELFGHARGAFTGALHRKTGLWKLADGGTLFLDEVGDLSLHHQVKILRALEDGAFRPVGCEQEVASAARVLAATNRDLAHMVAAGQFRQDLYYRLFAFRIRTPALRERAGDIPLLAAHFWQRVAGAKAPALPAEVLDLLQTWHWPGNARELRAFLTNVLLLAGDRPVDAALARAVMRDRLGPLAEGIHDV
jgi:transcriptional regulator of acetoin/glycerol metabolism